MTSRPGPVGRTRLTALGYSLVAIAVIGLFRQPAASDRLVMVMIWLAIVVVVVIGVVWPVVSVRRITISATSIRRAAVGDRPPVSVSLSGRFASCDVRLVYPAEPWHRASGPGTIELDQLADQRGVFPAVAVEVRVSGPVGVAAANRVHLVDLPTSIEVAPKPLAVDWVPTAAPLPDGVASPAGPVLSGDLVRSVRPYTPGDPAHLVHWPSTARTGALVVREVEPPVPVGQAIVVDLRGLGPDTERAASYAYGASLAVLSGGGELVLCTAEAGGPVTRRVRGAADASSRLARAVDGVPGAAPDRWPTVEIGQ